MTNSKACQLTLLGRSYWFRAPDGEEHQLQAAAQALEHLLTEQKLRFPHASQQELLVLTALNLCAGQTPQQQEREALVERLQRLVTCLQESARS